MISTSRCSPQLPQATAQRRSDSWRDTGTTRAVTSPTQQRASRRRPQHAPQPALGAGPAVPTGLGPVARPPSGGHEGAPRARWAAHAVSARLPLSRQLSGARRSTATSPTNRNVGRGSSASTPKRLLAQLGRGASRRSSLQCSRICRGTSTARAVRQVTKCSPATPARPGGTPAQAWRVAMSCCARCTCCKSTRPHASADMTERAARSAPRHAVISSNYNRREPSRKARTSMRPRLVLSRHACSAHLPRKGRSPKNE